MTKIGGAGVRGPQPPVQQSADQVSSDRAGEVRKKGKLEEKATEKTQAQAPTQATRADEFEIARPNPFQTLGLANKMNKATTSSSELQYKHEPGSKVEHQGAAQVKQELGRGGEMGFKVEAQKAGLGGLMEGKLAGKLHSTPSLVAQPSAGATAEAKAGQNAGPQTGHAATTSQQSRTHESPSERRGDVAEQPADVAQRRGDVTEQQGGVAERRGDVTEQQASPRDAVTATDSEASPVTQESPTEVRRSDQELREAQLELEKKLRKRPG